MALHFITDIALPAHNTEGGFDHAAVDRSTSRLYVAHTANDALDVIDVELNQYLYSISGLSEVAGALVSEPQGLIFTSNRGEDTVGILTPADGRKVAKVNAGKRPNGLAYNPIRGLLLAANVGEAAIPGSASMSMIDVHRRELLATIPAPGRTRWAVFDSVTDCFYVNIAEPPLIVAVSAGDPTRIARAVEVPARGPHGLDLDEPRRRLLCACDSGQLLAIDIGSGQVVASTDLSGKPDVIMVDASLGTAYVAVGDPGVVEVVELEPLTRVESTATERGAHTLALDAKRQHVFVLMPGSHSARVFALEN